MDNLSTKDEDCDEAQGISGNADSAMLRKSKIKTTRESVGYLESVIQTDKEYTDYLENIEGKRDDAVKELEELKKLWRQNNKKINEISEKMEMLVGDKTRLLKEQRIKDQVIQSIQSIEFEIVQKSLIVKMLKDEVLKRDFHQGSFTNKETIEDHIQDAQQQIMESVKYSNPSSLKIHAKRDKKSKRSQEHELSQQRFDTGQGIIIEGIFPKDFTCEVVPWTSDERLNIINTNVFPDGFTLETDLYFVKNSKTGGPLDGNTIPAGNMLLTAKIPKEKTYANVYYKYKGAVRFNNTWTLLEPKDKDIAFKVDGVESFCVISILPEERHTISPFGSRFISPIDNGIQVDFPSNVVDKEERICFQIHPVDMTCLSERKTQVNNDEVCISAITDGLSSKHRKFKKSLEIQLPLQYGSRPFEDDFDYRVFKWDDDGSFEFVDIRPVILNNTASFSANSFSGYGCVRTTKSQNTSSLASVVQEAYGLRKWCKILFFVGKTTNNNVPIMLECVDLQRVAEVCENREKYGYRFVSEWISKDFFLIPDKTIITVDVKGKFGIPKECSAKHPKLSFIPVAQDNFTRFLVELKTSGTVYGVLSIRDNRSVLDEIFYDPASTKKLPSNKKIRDELLGNRNDHLVISRSSTTGNLIGKDAADNSVADTKDDFFTEKGLLALSKLMSPSTILEICVNMDVPIAQCETIQQKYGTGSTLGNIALLQTSLDRQPDDKKIEKLIDALNLADQRSLVDKIQHLHSTGKGLHDVCR